MRRTHRAAHATIWLTLALLLPAILIGAFVLRGAAPVESAVRLPDQNTDR